MTQSKTEEDVYQEGRIIKIYTAKDYDGMRKLGLNPDEIRIKLDQIMEWNELPTVAKDK